MGTTPAAPLRADAPTAEALAEHSPGLVTLLTGLGYPPHDAEDAVQDAMLAGLVELRAGAGRVSNWPAWLRTVAVNAATRNVRRRLACCAHAALDVADGSADEIDRRDVEDALRAAIARLPDPLRRLVEFCGLEGGTYRDAVRRFGLHTATVNRRLHDARELIRCTLAASDMPAKKNRPAVARTHTSHGSMRRGIADGPACPQKSGQFTRPLRIQERIEV